jgi:hypothetical protein
MQFLSDDSLSKPCSFSEFLTGLCTFLSGFLCPRVLSLEVPGILNGESLGTAVSSYFFFWLHWFSSSCWIRRISSCDILKGALCDCKGPNRVGTTFILPEDENGSSFRNVVFLRKHWTMDWVQKLDSFKGLMLVWKLDVPAFSQADCQDTPELLYVRESESSQTFPIAIGVEWGVISAIGRSVF